MTQINKNTNSKSYVFARVRSHHYGESKSFTSADAALKWVQQASRELVDSGHTSVTFTIQGEYNRNEYQGPATCTHNCNHINAHPQAQNFRNKSITYEKAKEMREKSNNLTTDFFSVDETEIRHIATATMEAAMSSKELSDREFESAIADASNGMVTLRRSIKNPHRVDFCCWDAYTVTHAPRDPGKKPIEAIEKTIIDTYMLGQLRTSSSTESDASKSEISINNVLTSSCDNNIPADELIQNIIYTIHTHMLNDVNVKAYLSCHSAGLATELSNMTGGVITCSMSDDIVTLSCSTGVTSQVTTIGKTVSEIDKQLRTILSRYLLHASISRKTRDAIACIVNLESLADMALIEDLIADKDAPLYSYTLL